MLLSLRKNGLDSLFKEVRVLKVFVAQTVGPCLSRRVFLGHPAGVPRISLKFMCLFLS